LPKRPLKKPGLALAGLALAAGALAGLAFTATEALAAGAGLAFTATEALAADISTYCFDISRAQDNPSEQTEI
jgi:hypothetical protein